MPKGSRTCQTLPGCLFHCSKTAPSTHHLRPKLGMGVHVGPFLREAADSPEPMGTTSVALKAPKHHEGGEA